MTKILRINQINPESGMINEAADIIKDGGLVVFPTETVYGIGADAFNADACKKIFAAKGRPSDNPLIVHIANLEQLNKVASDTTKEFLDIAKILWPGPVTFILSKRNGMPDEVTSGLGSVAVRMPAHPIALRLIEASGTPIAAPSANISQRPSGTRIDHIIKDFDGKVDAIIDGGNSAFGLESTIIDARARPYVLLRPGAFTLEELQKYLGKILIPENLNIELDSSKAAIAPGMKYRHYSPEKRLIAVSDNSVLMKLGEIKTEKRIIVLCSNEISEIIGVGIRTLRLGSERDLYGIARNLFDALRKIDGMDIDVAIIQSFPERGIGLAVMNRIMKASGSNAVGSIKEIDECLNQP